MENNIELGTSPLYNSYQQLFKIAQFNLRLVIREEERYRKRYRPRYNVRKVHEG